MSSTFHGIEIGKNSLVTHRTGLNVIGHNLANQSNENYSRQRVNLSAMNPISMPGLTRANTPGQIGQGVQVQEIIRIRDAFVEDRVINQNGRVGYWDKRQFYLTQMEAIFNEPMGPSLKTVFEQFVNDWNFLANNPSEGSAREAVRNSAIALTSHINNTFNHLWTLRTNADARIRGDVDTINTISRELADLNNEISKIKAMGDNPNDLMDKRDALILELSELADIRTSRIDPDDFIVYIGSQVLVQGGTHNELSVINDINNEGMARIVWKDTGRDTIFQEGSIAALLEIRDVDIRKTITEVDNLASNLINTVNNIHKDGFGLNFNTQLDFFRARTLTENVNGDYDINNDGIIDSTILYSVNGTVELMMDNVIGMNGTINLGPSSAGGDDVLINYFETDRVKDVIDKINQSGANVVAYLDHRNRFTLKATINEASNLNTFYIPHIEDSGNLLISYAGLLKESGANGAFDWRRGGELEKLGTQNADLPKFNYQVTHDFHPARWISVDGDILRDINNIAAGRGDDSNGDGQMDRPNGHNDGTNALRIVAALVSENERSGLDVLTRIDQEPVIQDKNTRSFKGLVDRVIMDLGISARESISELEKENAIQLALVQTQESIKGVNLDEELSNMMMFQHGYSASAKFISVINQMLDTLMYRLGV